MRKNNIKNSNLRVTIYESNHIQKAGIHVWVEMFQELVTFRGLIWRLVVRDVSAKYKQSFLGILWAFLTPLIMMVVFVWIKNKNILPIKDTNMPYPAYVFLGQMVWLLFSHGITTTANSMVAASSMLSKINFPKETLVISAVGQTVFEFILRIPLLLIIFFWVGFVPNFSILLLPIMLIPLLFYVIGIGFLAALLNAVFRDIGSVLAIILNIGMFITPVVYPPPTSWPMSFLVNFINPISAFVIAAQDLVTVGYLTAPSSYIMSTIVGMVSFLMGWRIIHLIEPKIAEKI